MKRINSIILTMALLTACSKGETGRERIKIAVTASMKQGAEQLADEFMKSHPDKRIEVIAAASGTIAAQIINGAPFDIFMSADMKFPGTVYDRGFAVNSPAVYARGILLLFSRNGLNSSDGISILSGGGIKKIAIANPDTAPYGKAAVEAMTRTGVNTDGRIITGENIMQAASYGLSSADAAFISKSALFTPAMKKYREDKYWLEINPGLYSPVEHGMIILKKCRDMNACMDFYKFVLSPEGKKILKENGFNTD